MNLKDIAKNAAEGNIIPEPARPVNPESEIPSQEDMIKHTPSADGNLFIGETPVIINTPKKKSNEFEASSVETQKFVPTYVGLTEDSLNINSVNVDLSPMRPNSLTTVVNETPEVNVPNNTGYPQETLDMLESILPKMELEERIEFAKPYLENKDKLVKDYIINAGLTVEEANIAAKNKIKKDIQDAYAKHEDETVINMKVGDIIINKSDNPNDLNLTKEEHAKLEKVQRVRLVVVEDMDLANIKIERPSEEHKADYVNAIEGALSRYSVPLPMLGDFASFRGASMVQLVNAVNYEDATLDETINTKASLIYEKLMGGLILQKYDSNNKNILSYQEFANKFPFQDIDMAMYAILCASSADENSTSLTCQACSHQWIQNYNLRSLLKMDDLSEFFVERVDDIIKYKSNDIEMRKIYEKMRKATRYKSPFTGNIYDLSYPTVARAVNLLKRVNQNDNVMVYLSGIALYLSSILVYNSAKDSYVEVTADETTLLLDVMKSISNDDINMLSRQIRDDLYYQPTFVIHSECPSCHKVSDIPINIDSLIFLIARDSIIEIAN